MLFEAVQVVGKKGIATEWPTAVRTPLDIQLQQPQIQPKLNLHPPVHAAYSTYVQLTVFIRPTVQNGSQVLRCHVYP